MGQIIKSVFVCLCMYVSVGTPFSTNFHEIWQEPLGSEKKELIRLGSKSKNAFPYFNPKNPKFTAEIGNSQPNSKCKITLE